MVFDHLTYSVRQPVRDSVYHWFDPGQYGVFVFFLVSGYIVPASRSSRYALVAGVAAVALGGVLRPGVLSYDLLTPGVVVAVTDGVIALGLVLALVGRGRRPCSAWAGGRRGGWMPGSGRTCPGPGARAAHRSVSSRCGGKVVAAGRLPASSAPSAPSAPD